MPGSFIDTNILVYTASGVSAKADRAEKIIDDGGAISVQVLNKDSPTSLAESCVYPGARPIVCSRRSVPC